jgi:hypothetical protein
MARATTKADLETSANGQFEKMWKLIDTMSDERQNATFGKEMATAGKEATLEQRQEPARHTRTPLRMASAVA